MNIDAKEIHYTTPLHVSNTGCEAVAFPLEDIQTRKKNSSINTRLYNGSYKLFDCHKMRAKLFNSNAFLDVD